jgi:peptidoglycan/xylan/chitin deacetylase (PgdA/CDA1 family)
MIKSAYNAVSDNIIKSVKKNAFLKIIPRNFIIFRLEPKISKKVLLTFDDGPHPEHTPVVLDILERWNSRAIFFVVGRRIERAPHLLRMMKERGHIIGNHSYIHSNRRQPNIIKYLKDLDTCQSAIENHAGVKPGIFRPPGGRVTPAALTVSIFKKLTCVLWSKQLDEWLFETKEELLMRAKIMAEAVNPGDIILLHDDHPHISEVLSTILPIVTAAGMEFCDEYELKKIFKHA